MGFYPIMIDLSKFPVLLIGGGSETEFKVNTMLDSGAQITVIAENVTDSIKVRAHQKKLTWLSRKVDESDVKRAGMVIVTRQDPEELPRIINWCKKYGALLNVTDDPEFCQFYTTSHFRRGDLVVSVSTSGKAPAVAKALRTRLQRQIGPEFSHFVSDIATMRRTLRLTHPPRERQYLVHQAVDERIRFLHISSYSSAKEESHDRIV